MENERIRRMERTIRRIRRKMTRKMKVGRMRRMRKHMISLAAWLAKRDQAGSGQKVMDL